MFYVNKFYRRVYHIPAETYLLNVCDKNSRQRYWMLRWVCSKLTEKTPERLPILFSEALIILTNSVKPSNIVFSMHTLIRYVFDKSLWSWWIWKFSTNCLWDLDSRGSQQNKMIPISLTIDLTEGKVILMILIFKCVWLYKIFCWV